MRRKWGQMNDSRTGAEPPDCPWWCTEEHSNGWATGGGGLTRQCLRQVLGADDIDGHPTELELGRFAALVDGQVLVEPMTVRLAAEAALSIDSAASVAATMVRLAEMAGEPGVVAA